MAHGRRHVDAVSDARRVGDHERRPGPGVGLQIDGFRRRCRSCARSRWRRWRQAVWTAASAARAWSRPSAWTRATCRWRSRRRSSASGSISAARLRGAVHVARDDGRVTDFSMRRVEQRRRQVVQRGTACTARSFVQGKRRRATATRSASTRMTPACGSRCRCRREVTGWWHGVRVRVPERQRVHRRAVFRRGCVRQHHRLHLPAAAPDVRAAADRRRARPAVATSTRPVATASRPRRTWRRRAPTSRCRPW